MSEDILQIDYDQMEAIAKQFQGQAEAVGQMARLLNNHYSDLKNDGWVGVGADAFFSEFETELEPALARLALALEDGRDLSNQIAQVLRNAEEQAAAQVSFEADGAVGGPGAGGGGPVAGPRVGPGPGGGPPGTPGAGPGQSGSSGGWTWGAPSGSGKVNIFEYDHSQDPGSRGGVSPSIGVKYGVGGSLYGDPNSDGITAISGEGGVAFGLGENGVTAGLYGEYSTARAQYDTAFLGGDNLGATAGIDAKVLAAEGFVGIRDNSFGAAIGGTLVSAEGSVGVNVAGVNASVNGEIGLKAELGFQIGQETEIKLPFISIGFSFGGAKD